MILDEPTAALDPIAEEEVYTKFSEISNEGLTIYISPVSYTHLDV